ncbi:MAG: hypothetical protein ACRD3J_28715 [Thermoanaerobaculia bacterium]
MGASTSRGGDFDNWDLEVSGGLVGQARTLMAIEEHGGGRQLVRYRIEPLFSPLARGALLTTGLLALLLWLAEGTQALPILLGFAVVIVLFAGIQALSAASAIRSAAESAEQRK